EFAKNLHDTAHAHIKLNLSSCNDFEIFITLRDGALAFAGQTIGALMMVIAKQEQKLTFIKECQDIFNCYIQQSLEKIK
ncbi:MAG TPA: hypothetical protein VK590_06265, partial [Saprospiraceae bacterium]|nr:hypothetical protein [Saprospiraceae bacterium]